MKSCTQISIVFEVFVAAIIAIPGFVFNNILINFCDILIPTLFAYVILRKRDCKVTKNLFFLSIYVLSAFASIILYNSVNSWDNFTPLIKWIRLAYLPMVGYIVEKYFADVDIELYSKLVVKYGTISAALAIYLFLTQNQYYTVNQTLSFNGEVFFRAGGIYREAMSLALMMLVVIINILFILRYERVFKLRFWLLVSLLLSVISIVFSDTRTVTGVLFLILIYYLVKFLSLKIICVVIVGALLVTCIYFNNLYLERFVDERIVGTIFSDIGIERKLSGRSLIWSYYINDWINTDLVVEYIFGTGYKCVDEDFYLGHVTMMDNNYLSSLVNCGLLGFLGFLGYWYCVFRNIVNAKFNRHYTFLITATFVASIVVMVFCDAMTMYRVMSVIIILFSMMSQSYKKI